MVVVAPRDSSNLCTEENISTSILGQVDDQMAETAAVNGKRVEEVKLHEQRGGAETRNDNDTGIGVDLNKLKRSRTFPDNCASFGF